MLLQLFNCFLVRPNDGELTNCLTSLWVDTLTGKIIHVGEFERQSTDLDCFGLTEPILQEGEILAASKIDLNGQILAPGLIDIQINGSYDVDYSNWKGNEPQYRRGIQITSKNLPQTGVTAYIPTIISQSPAVYHKVLPLITDVARIHAMQRDQRACCEAAQSGVQVLGFHAEGPFLSPEKIGCHPKANAITAEEGWKAFEDVYGEASLKRDQSVRPSVKLITMAPELPGVMDCIARLVDAGFVISIGHSAANTIQATKAVFNGATLITHLFNAMNSFHHREPGIIGLLSGVDDTAAVQPSQQVNSKFVTPSAAHFPVAQLPVPIQLERVNDHNWSTRGDTLVSRSPLARPFWSCIVDGLHVHPSAVRLAYRAFPEGCVLITDAVSVMDPHLKDGVYPWRKDGHSITKSGDAIKLTGTDTLAGAAVPLDSCVRNLAKFSEIPLSRAIHCATRNPATAIGGWVEATKGALKVGYDADLTVWDPVTRQITATWIAGHVYNDRNARE